MADGHETVSILDFGSQYTRLIARHVREAGVFSEIVPHTIDPTELKARGVKAVILSGGPASVHAADALDVDAGVFDLGVPVLGICYGQQLMAAKLGGRVTPGRVREYGRADVTVRSGARLLAGLDSPMTVWMSHGDKVDALPPGFEVEAESAGAPFAAVHHRDRPLFGVQFHPEVQHTPQGRVLLHRFLFDIAGCRGDWTSARFTEEAVVRARARVGDAGVVLGLSGGVDSSVAALILHRAVGDRLTCVFVDNGLLRKDEARQVEALFRGRFGLNVLHVDASDYFLSRLAGVDDPEQKRKIIGAAFIDVFEAEAKKIDGVRFLGQGTIYPDVIESAGTKGPAAVIKSHHNVGGLPARMNLSLVEPLRELFKDEVRAAGRELGLPAEMLGRHPFPGPGLAVRVLGEVTRERCDVLREADARFIQALRDEGLYDAAAQAFAVLLPVKSVGVMGDGRTYENVVALRAVTTDDFMTADWARLPYDFLARVSNRIINEVRGVNRVVYDISSKPPATIEWE